MENKAQTKKRWIVLGIPAALLLAGVVVSFIVRIQWLTIALTIALGAYAIFSYSMLLSPLICYGRHLAGCVSGRTSKTEGAFKSMEEAPVPRDGVMFYAMMLNVGDMDEEEDDRLFYYDANKPRPDWQVGDRLIIFSHDKAVAKWQRA